MYNLIFDRTAAGTYGAEDLNRVSSAAAQIAADLEEMGYKVDYKPVYPAEGRTEWQRTDLPKMSQLNTYLGNIRSIRAAIKQAAGTPHPPPSMRFLDWKKANDIERALDDTEIIIEKIKAAYIYSGEIYAGEA